MRTRPRTARAGTANRHTTFGFQYRASSSRRRLVTRNRSSPPTNRTDTGWAKAASAAVKTAGGVGRVLPGAGGTTRWVLIANDAATAAKVADAFGLAG